MIIWRKFCYISRGGLSIVNAIAGRPLHKEDSLDDVVWSNLKTLFFFSSIYTYIVERDQFPHFQELLDNIIYIESKSLYSTTSIWKFSYVSMGGVPTTMWLYEEDSLDDVV